jgi:hypothetical protein
VIVQMEVGRCRALIQPERYHTGTRQVSIASQHLDRLRRSVHVGLGSQHSDVPSQALSAQLIALLLPCRQEVSGIDRAEVRAGPEDVGDQTLIRGLDTAFPFVRPGLSLSKHGRRSCDRPHSAEQEFPCRGPALASARLKFDDALLLLACCYV